VIVKQCFYDFTLGNDDMGEVLADIRDRVKKEFRNYTPVIHQVIHVEDDYYTAIVNIMDYD
jgi:hypothetical protein